MKYKADSRLVKRMDSSKELTQNSIILHIIKLMYINYARTKLRAVGEGGVAQRRMQHDAAGVKMAWRIMAQRLKVAWRSGRLQHDAAYEDGVVKQLKASWRSGFSVRLIVDKFQSSQKSPSFPPSSIYPILIALYWLLQ